MKVVGTSSAELLILCLRLDGGGRSRARPRGLGTARLRQLNTYSTLLPRARRGACGGAAGKPAQASSGKANNKRRNGSQLRAPCGRRRARARARRAVREVCCGAVRPTPSGHAPARRGCMRARKPLAYTSRSTYTSGRHRCGGWVRHASERGGASTRRTTRQVIRRALSTNRSYSCAPRLSAFFIALSLRGSGCTAIDGPARPSCLLRGKSGAATRHTRAHAQLVRRLLERNAWCCPQHAPQASLSSSSDLLSRERRPSVQLHGRAAFFLLTFALIYL
jgi:hypothetical protein